MLRKIVVLSALVALSSCAASSSMRVSQNEMIIKTRAAPICGDIGAMKVAQKQAAIETIKAGYDRYVILGQQSQDTTRVVQTPGSYQTTGMMTSTGMYSATTTYQPGMSYVTGGHGQDLAVRMFKDGEPGAANALDARSILGPKWPQLVKADVMTCSD